MTPRIRQWILIVAALGGAVVGIWAGFLPQSWYDAFPGFGRQWLPVLGPYNEHLIRDVGTLYLGLTVITLGAALRPADNFLMRLVGAGWLVFSVPHLVFHLIHLGMYGPLDQLLNVVALGFYVVVGLVLLIPVRVTAPVGA